MAWRKAAKCEVTEIFVATYSPPSSSAMDFEGEDTQDGFSAGRTMDIELGGQEIITIDLDTLDEDPNDFIDLLTDAQCEVSTWVKLTCEYLKKDLVAAADKIARKALQGA